MKDTLIEIDLVGYVPAPGLDVRVVKSGIPHQSHTIRRVRRRRSGLCRGAAGDRFQNRNPESAKKKAGFPFYGSDIKLQTEYILKNLATTFAAAGSSLDNVVKAQVFLTDLSDFAGFDEVWRYFFKTPPPAAQSAPADC